MAITIAPSAELRALFTKKLLGSGIKPEQSKKYKLELLTAEVAAHQLPGLPLYTGGIKITYFSLEGKPTKGYRFRYLEGEKKNGFAALANNGNGAGPWLRYAQPKGSNPMVYWSPVVPWPKIASNTAMPIYITEGEFKAIAACQQTLACVGLGGVQMFSDRRNGEAFLTELQRIDWKGRTVYIVFDSDSASNPNVRDAEYRLAHELTNQGGIPYIVRLPNILGEGGKTGLDDYLLKYSAAEFEALAKVGEPFVQCKELYRMAQEVVYINEPDVMYRLPTAAQPKGLPMRTDKFVSSHYAHWRHIDSRGEKAVEKSTAAEFVRWQLRPQLERFTFAPGKPRVIGDSFNTWSGWPYEAAKGDVSLWHQFMEWIFQGKPPGQRKWFEQWLAYPMQHPGTKLKQAVVFWGIEGSGKTFCGQLIQRLYGANHSVTFGNADMMSNYNSYAENIQFAVCNEVTAKSEERRQISETLKTLVTEPTITIHHKYLKPYPMPNCMNIMFTSNHAVPIKLGGEDRRYFIHNIEGGRMDSTLATALDKAQYTVEFNAALFYYFLHLDLRGFNPMGEPVLTAEKEAMMQGSRTDYEEWLVQLRNEAEIVLHRRPIPYKYNLATSEEIYSMYAEDHEGERLVGRQTIANALSQLNFTKAYKGAVRTSTGSKNIWVLRHPGKYMNLTPKQVGELYDGERELKFAKKAGK